MNLKYIALGLFLLFTAKAYNQDSIPEPNKQIIKYVNSVLGKKVDRGECWDLAYQALTRINAVWDGQFKYGKLLDPQKDSIYPGDIIQFKNVVVKYTEGNTTHTEEMKQHTAIVFQVYGKGDLELAHQNTSFSGRLVGLSKLNLKHISKGKIFIYRPVVIQPQNLR